MAMKGGQVTIIVDADTKRLNKNLKKAKKSVLSFGKIAETAIGFSVANAAMRATEAVKTFVISSVKLAIDAQETFSKFETVFENVALSAELVARDLDKSWGLSSVAAKQLLADTGDMLVGFGFTERAALELSEQTQKLAIDLASFTNLQGGSARASAILTRGLLGERESMKTLGIAILETDLQQKLLEKGQNNLTGSALKMAKAQATLEIAMEQSGKALGDWGRTSDETANQIKDLTSEWTDFKVEFGEFIEPAVGIIVARLTEKIKELRETMSQLEGEQGKGRQIAAGAVKLFTPEPLKPLRGKIMDFLEGTGILGEKIDTLGDKIDGNTDAQEGNTNSTDTNTKTLMDSADFFGSKGTARTTFEIGQYLGRSISETEALIEEDRKKNQPVVITRNDTE